MGLAPEAFWRLSVAEWRALNTGPEHESMTRQDLERLAEAWPDQGPDHEEA